MEHPRDEQLIAWIDEPGHRDDGVGAHIEACSACRDRTEQLESLYAELSREPEWPGEAAFGRQRARIAELIGTPIVIEIDQRRSPQWIPLAAAAVVAALIIFGVMTRAPMSEGPSAGLDHRVNGLAVVEAADQAADEVVQVASWVDEIDPSMATSSPEWTFLEEEFEALPTEDRTEILDELELMSFDL